MLSNHQVCLLTQNRTQQGQGVRNIGKAVRTLPPAKQVDFQGELKTSRLHKHRLLLALLYGCGLRNLHIKDVDMDSKQLHIRRGKGRKDRYVPLWDLLIRGKRISLSFNSCRNRQCPQGQEHKHKASVRARESELLNVPYFHVVFTPSVHAEPIVPICSKRFVRYFI
uniref:transposase zinc-binding domain-containing protein n=1 Tax=Pricia antarctica TaxID=641691 RepID=UPI0015876B86|nr:transposase zinc-binding domain-containing protein [Pricia antarctica]